MADEADRTRPGGADPDRAKLEELGRRIEAAKSPAPARPHSEEHYSQANLAWRMVIELVAGLGIGFAIGYGLDMVFGTLPFLLVVFTLMGFAAGVKTMVASAREVQEKTEGAEAPETERD